jgi:hypothetical protein
MAELVEIEKNDVILANGKNYRVLSVFKPDGEIKRVDGIDDTEDSPIRRTIWSKDIQRIVRKAPVKLKSQPEPQPEGKVVEKEPIPEGVKKDVQDREHLKTSSSETAKKNQDQAGARK